MKSFTPFRAAIFAAACFTGLASASVILLDSRAGLLTDAPGTTVNITAHPLWEASNPLNPGDPSDTSAVWISYADTGFGGSHFQPFEGTTPIVSIFDSFTSGAGLLNLNVWADDSADVLLDGAYLAHAAFTQSTCSGQPIGCRPQDVGVISAALSSGDHTLAFVLYQTGTGTDTTNNPFGLLYSGTATDAVPEPGTGICLLAGVFLIAAGLLKRRRPTR